MKLPIKYIGEPVLREKAQPIESITDEIIQLAKDMIETMHSKNAVGLAAPQVGQSLRMFVLTVLKNDGDKRVSTEEDRVYINPKILEVSHEIVGMNEGCLSIPGLYIDDVLRPKTITVSSLNLEGKEIVETISGWHARVVLHENDHLNGVLFIDRLQPRQKKGFEEEIKKIKRKYEKKS